MKRVSDILLSGFGLILLSPVFLVLALLVKLGSKGPVFFIQERMGRNFNSFGLLKFRTMVEGAPAAGPAITAKGDPRITGVGKFLRKTKMDELPQLINVLKGDMSLVGPRPEVRKYVEAFEKDYRKILTVRPGITDFATIEYRDEEAVLAKYGNPEEGYVKEVLPQKIKLYERYLEEAGFFLDMKLIFRTLYEIVK